MLLTYHQVLNSTGVGLSALYLGITITLRARLQADHWQITSQSVGPRATPPNQRRTNRRDERATSRRGMPTTYGIAVCIL